MDNPKGDFTMNHELYEEAIHSDVLSEKLISQLLESMEYSSISFINWSIEVLKLIRVRIERGDKIKDEVSGEIYCSQLCLLAYYTDCINPRPAAWQCSPLSARC